MEGAGRFAVLGAGSWGTVLAVHLARQGHRALLWCRREEHYQAMRASGSNETYLPATPFPAGVVPVHDIEEALEQADDLVVAVPAAGFRPTVSLLVGRLRPRHRIAWGTKGLEPGSHLLLHQVIREELGDAVPLAAVSGPTFAAEVARGLPTGVTIAASDAGFARGLARALHGHGLVAFTSTDLVGVEIGGAVKNVVAIGAGIGDGLKLGGNTRAAVITLGLREMVRLGTALGALAETFRGLSGVGDLVLTCSDGQSRNRRFGLALGRGMPAETALAGVGRVVEGAGAAVSVHALSRELGVQMPICTQVYRVLRGQTSPADALEALLPREPEPETR